MNQKNFSLCSITITDYCKRVALVPMLTDAACLQSALDPITGSRISSPKTYPERSVYGLPFVDVENKNYGKRKRGTPGMKKGLFQMTDISLCVGTLWHG